jgi:hypothetical protein
VQPNAIIDLVVKPTGTNLVEGSLHNDWCDGSIAWLQVDKAVPPRPRLSIGHDEEQHIATLTWSSCAGATYTIQATQDFLVWTNLQTVTGVNGRMAFSLPLDGAAPPYRFFRLIRQ